MPQPLNFQSIIMTLQDYWARQGCLIWQPYYTQVGAGTMNPATCLRVLGPEPWRVGYVEPSIRPDDGRYGENPNRMQMHYQFQVILKPDPGNPQELYLDSLQALGIDPRQHDIRFVEDNWESPALGAWGLGWEVWLDGQEITQFTYFQQSGGQVLDPVSVELTYGLERIAIALQRVSSFREIRWSETLTDGDVNLQAEQEHSKYYFEIADVERLRQMYALFESEAKTCLEHGLVLPAHDYLLKCSHTFNILDARGAIGVTERQAFFARMREVSSRIAEAYLAQRQQLGFPWMTITQDKGDESGKREEATKVKPQEEIHAPGIALRHAPFLLEVGTEELPVGDLEAAVEQLSARFPPLLDELRLGHGEVKVMATPRRLLVYVEALAPRQADVEQVVKGPPAARAFNPDGTPTQAAIGFARSKGVTVQELQVREMDGGSYVVAVMRQVGRPASEVLTEVIPGLLASLRFEKSMRWNHTNVAFSRPIRWLLGLFGDQHLDFEFAGVRSGRSTRGLRFMGVEAIPVVSPADYFRVLSEHGIVLEVNERRGRIRSQAEALAAEVGGQVAEDDELLAEVANLVEAPTVLRGSFASSHLELPRQVLISVMKKHQRYFPVEQDGKLLPYFIMAVNKPSLSPGKCEGAETIVEGNEHVIRARFSDAAFFVREDLKRPLEDYLPRLKTLTFQERLGSMLDKTHRIRALVEDLIPLLGLDEAQAEIARRAAELCKADLVTHMVIEMTSLQGEMGRYYALQSGEPQAVAEAILEHYLPRFTGDATPRSAPGLAVGLADRLDTLMGLFAAGVAPTGSKDPFAQRRTALGLVQNLITWKVSFSLSAALRAAAAHLPIPVDRESLSACLDFILERLRNLLLEQGWRYDVVDAVLAMQGEYPARAAAAVEELSAWVARSDWRSILPAFARCVRITRGMQETYPVVEEVLAEAAEKDLYKALLAAEATPRRPGSVDDYLNAFVPMIPQVNRFFDEVLVMTDDLRVQRNRLGLLQRIVRLAEGVADMSRLEGF